MNIGPYIGEIAERCRQPAFLARLADLPALLASPGAQVIADGRNRHVRVRVPGDAQPLDVLVKVFGRESGLKQWRDRRRGSKARRTWQAADALAARGVGTPPPLGYLERWQDGRLVESFFLAEFLPDGVSFKDALLTLYHEDPDCARLMALLQVVADGVRAMHAAGFQHNDLGNQNILLRPRGPGAWGEPQFIDLNRGRLRPVLSLRQRARDLSRVALPSDLLRVFIEMYWAAVPPAAFLRWERHFRLRYAVHAGSRRWRHPLREASQARREAGIRDYPAPRDFWIWDERSGQAISALRSRDRTRHYRPSRLLRLALDTAGALPEVWGHYQHLLAGAFQSPVALGGRIGMAIDPDPNGVERELDLLGGLGNVPVLLRFYHHESVAARRARVETVHRLRGSGHAVTIALVQDRRAVKEPEHWRAFALDVLHGVGDAVVGVEVGHAINRVKWGVWDLQELSRLYGVLHALKATFPKLDFLGPAAIDFEYPFVVSALRAWPPEVPLTALSHHLYVDRRGAPENRQGRFAALEKFALARAVARQSMRCGDRVVVSEVNWPLKGTGVYSPVGSPYESPGPRYNDPSVSEDEYADYMIRYLCLALCSGLVERVFWWRLVARGFGLVDDTQPDAWRPRPAYAMLRAFLAAVGHAEFESATLPPGAMTGGDTRGVYAYRFKRADGERLALTYAHGPAVPFAFPLAFDHVDDALGQRLQRPPQTLSGRPVYVRGLRG
ncbi:MAG: hypothetical protein K8T26_19175 [Lentisphaerae bacterium]|nr:hypothetical protein [Lentisphaerota bacterium]